MSEDIDRDLSEEGRVLEQEYKRKPQDPGTEDAEWLWACSENGGCGQIVYPSGGEAMTNGGFEDGLNNWVIENAQCLSTSTYHSGSKGLYMKTIDWYYPRIRQDLTHLIPVSRVYTLSFWAMTYFAYAYYNHISIYVIYTDDTETYFDYYIGVDSTWVQYIIPGSSLSFGKTIKQIKLECNQYVPGGYYLFFDDISLVVLPYSG